MNESFELALQLETQSAMLNKGYQEWKEKMQEHEATCGICNGDFLFSFAPSTYYTKHEE